MALRETRGGTRGPQWGKADLAMRVLLDNIFCNVKEGEAR